MELTITEVNPLEYAAELKELFGAHERPDFAEYFDRCYPEAVAAGARSWIGQDAAGRVVMHVGRIPHRFARGGETYTAGIVANILVAKEHRSRAPALSLFRRMIDDTRAAGEVDFLYTDPTERAARVLIAAGFTGIGRMGRYAAPVRDRRGYVDAALRALQGGLRVASRAGRWAVERHPAAAFDPSPYAAPAPHPQLLRAYAPPDLYRRRLQGYPSARDQWYTVRELGDASPGSAVLVRGPDAEGVATIVKVALAPAAPLPALLAALYPALREGGSRRVQVVAPVGSRLAAALARSGFLLRESVPLVALATTGRAEPIVGSAQGWQITQIDCDS